MPTTDLFIFGAQAASVVLTFWWSLSRAAFALPLAAISIALRATGLTKPPSTGGAAFFLGHVMHTRKKPKENSFTYPVRMALIDLDDPPAWWTPGHTGDTLSADSVRDLAGTSGRVRVLTHPPAAGYTQNPISVYYCYEETAENAEESGRLKRCVAEVTNTPWGERVTFVFRPAGVDGCPLEGEAVPKALHVSPLMDMRSTWHVKAPPPSDTGRLFLSVGASHPEYGDYFLAVLDARRDTASPDLPNETATLATLWRYGFQPQRVAGWIYWQAVVLLWKGVRFFSPPGTAYQAGAAAAAKHPKTADGRAFVWRPARGWPWGASKKAAA